MLLQWLKALFCFAEQQVVPHVSAWISHWTIAAKLTTLRDAQFIVETSEETITESQIQDLKVDAEAELKRSERIVEKGRSGLFAIGVTVALITAIVRFSITNSISIAELIVLLWAIAYFTLSAICLTQAVNIYERAGFYLDDLVQNRDGKLTTKIRTKAEILEGYYRHGQFNQKVTIIISNYVAASFCGLRNGVILFSIFFAITIVNSFLK